MKRTLRLAALVAFCVLTFAARCHNLRDVFVEGRIYFLDADCYSRMTRARMVAEHPGMIVRHHDFENFPQGVNAHTTAPLDYLIVAGKKVLDAGFAVFDSGKASVLHDQTLDLAGALVGPLLGVVGMVFLVLWAWALRLRYWAMPALLYAVSPILVHGMALGRPDHQALLIVLLIVALGAEFALARKTDDADEAEGASPLSRHPERSGAQSKDLSHPAGGGGGESDDATPTASAPEKLEGPRLRSAPLGMTGWGTISGVAWALSLWVSLYEPLILLGTVLVLWLACDRRALFAPARRPGWIAFAAILALAFLLEGWRIEMPDAAMREYFSRWQGQIGELAHLDPFSPQLWSWLGWTAAAAPVLLFLTRKTDRRALPVLAVLAVAFALTLWQLRWGYFLAAAFVLALPVFLPALRRPWLARTVFALALWPVAQDWDGLLFPAEARQQQLAVKRAEADALRSVVSTKTGTQGGAFVAPWWLSPSIAYWTRQPGVAGSSHESLPGIVAAARIYLARDTDAALPLLRERRVTWILADAAERVIPNAAKLLGVPAPEYCLATELARPFHEDGGSVEIVREAASADPSGRVYYQIWQVRAGADTVPTP
ncbi:MAG: hypothetical protein K8R23_20565 [Chthoniobacter sp.]|nr:hypothetical protein [Chthoniobacter sp.]